MQRSGRITEAADAFDEAIKLDPNHSMAHFNRGCILLEERHYSEALDAQIAALKCMPIDEKEHRESILSQIVQAARKAGRLSDAERVARAELPSSGNSSAILDQLALILEYSRRPHEANAIRDDIAIRAGVARHGLAADYQASVLVLSAVGCGHVPFGYLLDPRRFRIFHTNLLSPNHGAAPLGEINIDTVGATIDVVFSALADPEHDGGQFAAVDSLCGRLKKPVLNQPKSITRTSRDRASELFLDIPGMLTPSVRRVRRSALIATSLHTPLLIRPIGVHGGDELKLLRSEPDKQAFLSSSWDDEFFVTEFYEFKSPDGYWRKYRMIFVDRKVYPYHLAIGEDWLVHYWRTGMGVSHWKKAEEEQFLDDWRGVFGELAADAVEEVARRLDLDFGGMDCAKTRDGKLLLFEANACMLVHLDEPAEAFPYKHKHVAKIRDAFSSMLLKRASASPAVSQSQQ